MKDCIKERKKERKNIFFTFFCPHEQNTNIQNKNLLQRKKRQNKNKSKT